MGVLTPWPPLLARRGGNSAAWRLVFPRRIRLALDGQGLNMHVRDLDVRARVFDVTHGVFHDLIYMGGVVADAGEAKDGELAQVLVLDLGGGQAELVAQAGEQRLDDLALVFERLAGGDTQRNLARADVHERHLYGGDIHRTSRDVSVRWMTEKHATGWTPR